MKLFVALVLILGLLAGSADASTADVNGDGLVDEDDALILYYAYALETLLGDGTSGGVERFRRTLLGSRAGGSNPSDSDLRRMLLNASAWREIGATAGGDLNRDGVIDEDDALAMYYAHALESLVGNGVSGGVERFRRTLLGSRSGLPDPRDADINQMLRWAQDLTGRVVDTYGGSLPRSGHTRVWRYTRTDFLRFPTEDRTAEEIETEIDKRIKSAGFSDGLDAFNAARLFFQPELRRIGAPQAYSRGALGSDIRIGIEDSGVDTLNLEFAGRIRYKGANLAYWRPLAFLDVSQAFGSCLRPQFGLPPDCWVFEIDAGGDSDRIQEAARYVTEVLAGRFPSRDNTWFIRDIRMNFEQAWYEIPALYGNDRDYWHGTQVASIAAGWFFGVAPGAEIVPVAVNLSASPLGFTGRLEQDEIDIVVEVLLDQWESEGRLDEFDALIAPGVDESFDYFDIINRSYGTRSLGSLIDFIGQHLEREIGINWFRANLPRTWAALIQQGRSEKTIEVWAAGNDEQPAPSIDAALPFHEPLVRGHLLAVAAIDSQGSIPLYSNACGPLPTNWNPGQHGRHYCLSAPGTLNAVKPDPDLDLELIQFGTTAGDDVSFGIHGTSFAAPMVSGGIALVMDLFRDQLSHREAALRVVNTANNRGIYSDSDLYGAGLLDLDAATRPVGTVQTGTDSVQGSVVQTRLRVPAAWGDLGGRLAGIEVAGFDAWNAPFWQPAGSFVQSSEFHPRIPLPESEPVWEQSALLPELRWAALSSPANEGLAPSLGSGLKLRMTASDDTAFLTRTAGGARGPSLRSPQRILGFSGELVAGARVGLLMETGANQGNRASGGFGNALGSQLAWVSREHTWSLGFGNDWTLLVSYLFAAGRPDYERGAMFEAGGSLYSAASVALEWRNDRKRTRWSIEQPLRAESGRGVLRYPTGRSREGDWTFAQTRVSLVPETREVRLRLRHDRPLGSGRLSVEMLSAYNAGHVSGERRNWFGLGYRVDW